MNYRHAFHAGNFADVVKHVALVCLLRKLTDKPKPLAYVETHAGRGTYDLRSESATRGGEAAAGVHRAAAGAAADGPLGDYLDIVRAVNPSGDIRTYPGSPAIAAALMRPGDRAILCEREPGEARALEALFRADRRFSVQCADGYTVVRAVLPPTPRRGLLLMDPPYESPDDVDQALAAIAEGLDRWRTGVFALWYPIKERREAVALRRRLQALGEPGLALEFCATPDDNPGRLNGAGLAVLRPPWKLDSALHLAVSQLGRALCDGRPARAEVITLADGDSGSADRRRTG